MTRERGALLHNMSAPTKSVVKYRGLADLAGGSGPGGSGVCGLNFRGTGSFGTAVRFALAAELRVKSASALLRHLGVDPLRDAAAQLDALVDQRANELPLPDGCAVISCLGAHRLIWADPLSALAILSKCSDNLWLRAMNPSLGNALKRRQASLLVPPAFAIHLPKEAT